MCLKERKTTQMIRCIYIVIKGNGKQFVDFLKRLDKRYDDKNIQNIFIVLDNLSVLKSKMVKKEEISKRCARIRFVFLPVSTELNLIEVEDGCNYEDKQLTIHL
jgi:hypothetical protein